MRPPETEKHFLRQILQPLAIGYQSRKRENQLLVRADEILALVAPVDQTGKTNESFIEAF